MVQGVASRVGVIAALVAVCERGLAVMMVGAVTAACVTEMGGAAAGGIAALETAVVAEVEGTLMRV